MLGDRADIHTFGNPKALLVERFDRGWGEDSPLCRLTQEVAMGCIADLNANIKSALRATFANVTGDFDQDNDNQPCLHLSLINTLVPSIHRLYNNIFTTESRNCLKPESV